MSKRILFLSWKDITHPSAGGAELVTDMLAQHMAHAYDVTYFTSSYPGARAIEIINGYTIIRRGSVYTTYIHAWLWWHKRKRTYVSIVDQVHGFPFFSLLYLHHPPVTTLVMEVAGKLWDTSRLAFIGKILEQAWLWMYKTSKIVTISKSTHDELVAHGIVQKNIALIPMFSHILCEEIPQKAQNPTLLVIGRIAPVKRIEDAIDAYTLAKQEIASLQLVIIGKTETSYEAYKSYLVKKISTDSCITFIENGSEDEKKEWLAKAHLLVIPSKKEGYGLVILEAAACGTPAIGYNVDGIRDAIIDQETGILSSQETPDFLASSICEILTNTARYIHMQKTAFIHAKVHTVEHTVSSFEHHIQIQP